MAQVFKYLTDENGNSNANGDYSGQRVEFSITARVYETLSIARMIIYIEDAGSFDVGGYGSGPALPVGIRVEHQLNSGQLITPLSGGVPIQKAVHWKRLCYDQELANFGSGNECLTTRWTFAKSGRPLQLAQNDRLVVILNDDLSHLSDHRFCVQGVNDFHRYDN